MVSKDSFSVDFHVPHPGEGDPDFNLKQESFRRFLGSLINFNSSIPIKYQIIALVYAHDISLGDPFYFIILDHSLDKEAVLDAKGGLSISDDLYSEIIHIDGYLDNEHFAHDKETYMLNWAKVKTEEDEKEFLSYLKRDVEPATRLYYQFEHLYDDDAFYKNEKLKKEDLVVDYNRDADNPFGIYVAPTPPPEPKDK